MTIIYALLMICVLIFLHELGHFIAAKACGVKVNEFALGMGPKILKKQKGETLYSIRALPIGGFCAMEGEDEESDDDRAFNNKKLWQKAIIIVAGAFMNLVVAVVLMIGISYYQGIPTTAVGEVVQGSPAQIAGIIKDDKIIEINGTAIKSWEQFTEVKKSQNKEAAELLVEREGKEITLTAKYEKNDAEKIIGIKPKVERDLIKSIIQGPEKTWTMGAMMYKSLGQLVTGKLSAKDLSGPVGIVYVINRSISNGGAMMFYLMALISLNLAIVNMLPLPALDGGRLLMAVVRKLTGKAISDKTEGYIHAIGLFLLLALTVYVTYNDILKFILPIFK